MTSLGERKIGRRSSDPMGMERFRYSKLFHFQKALTELTFGAVTAEIMEEYFGDMKSPSESE